MHWVCCSFCFVVTDFLYVCIFVSNWASSFHRTMPHKVNYGIDYDDDYDAYEDYDYDYDDDESGIEKNG